MYGVDPVRSEYGFKTAVCPSGARFTALLTVWGSLAGVRVNVENVTVAGSLASSNLAVTLLSGENSVASLDGFVNTTAGASGIYCYYQSPAEEGEVLLARSVTVAVRRCGPYCQASNV